jgi:hypothetical protein
MGSSSDRGRNVHRVLKVYSTLFSCLNVFSPRMWRTRGVTLRTSEQCGGGFLIYFYFVGEEGCISALCGHDFPGHSLMWQRGWVAVVYRSIPK